MAPGGVGGLWSGSGAWCWRDARLQVVCVSPPLPRVCYVSCTLLSLIVLQLIFALFVPVAASLDPVETDGVSVVAPLMCVNHLGSVWNQPANKFQNSNFGID